MPLTPPVVTGALLGALPASGFIGISVPQLAAGIAAGVNLWTTSALQVVTVDVGTLGVGIGVLPCIVPPALLISSMLTTFPATGHFGPFAPALATGIGLGLSIAFPSGLITTTHPTVGLGAAVATFFGTSVPSMIAGFTAAGMVGPMGALTATAVGAGIDITFAVLKLPIPILGPPNIVPSGGAGFGKIL